MYRKQKKIPTFIALLLLIFGLGSAVYLDSYSQRFTTSAQLKAEAEDIHITNITDNSFVLSWFTQLPIIGTVLLNDGLNTKVYLDDLDTDNIPRPRTSHYITINNLKEKTEYEVKIQIGNNKCSSTSCHVIRQKTGPSIAIAASSLPALHGIIETSTNKPAYETIVYISIGKAAPLSTRVDKAGLWATPLNNIRSQDLLYRPEISDNDIVQITGKNTPNLFTQAVIDVKSVRLNFQLPSMQLGKSYNFVDLLSKKDLFSMGNNLKILGSQTNRDNQPSYGMEILFPKEEADVTVDNRPLFRGTGTAGNQILITVNSSPQIDRITVGTDGTWSWRPADSLSPGTHHISIQGYNKNGEFITVKRKFIVLKSGERVLGEATSSASLTPTISPSPTVIQISSTPTIVFSPTPTLPSFLSPTQTIPPVSPTITSIIMTPTPPRSGFIQPALFLIGGGLLFSFIGIKFLLAS